MAVNGKTKLHQLLAVEGNLKGQANKVMTGLTETFKSKRHLFESKLVTFVSSEEGGQTETVEQSNISTTVPAEIEWISKHLAKAWDAAYLVDEGNTKARADVETEDKVILLKDVPATALLQLEKRIQEVKDLVSAIPTLDPAKGFKPDADSGPGWYQARTVVREKTRKEKKVLKAAAATDRHPEQVVVYDADVVIGKNHHQEWSTLLTPAMKADLLAQAEIALRAVTAARSRANEQEIDLEGKKIGETLLDFIFKPLRQPTA